MYARFIREAGGLGDVVRIIAIGQGLKEKYKDVRVHYFGPSYLRDLIAPRTNAIDIYFSFDCSIRPRDSTIDENVFPHLNVGIKYDISLDGWCPPYLHEPNTNGVCCQDRTELWCRIGGLPFTRPRLIPTQQDEKIRDNYQKRYKKIIGIQPGATCRSREWPYHYWNELVTRLIKKGIHVILFDVCYRWQDEIKNDKMELSINKSWPETVGKLLACDLVITPDSGFYHLAGALQIPSLGIFGCTSGLVISRPWQLEIKTGYYEQLLHKEIDVKLLPEGCMPICYMRWERGWKGDRYRVERKYCSLMEQLTVDRVEARITRLLNGQDDAFNVPSNTRLYKESHRPIDTIGFKPQL